MEKYFTIKQLSPFQGWHVGRSFVKISEGKLERIGGDTSYRNLLEIRDDSVTISKEANLEYEIQELDKNVFDSLILNYHKIVWDKMMSQRNHSYRRRN
jgi:hypothetical protein